MAAAALVSSDPRGSANASLRVLVVDDCPADTRLVRTHLAQAAETTEIESTSALDEALFMLSSGRFDLALVDHDLGPSTGLDLIGMARRRGVTCPLILVTGTAASDVEMSALEQGASDFIAKSELRPRTLRRAIRYNLRRAADGQRIRHHKRRLDAFIAGSNDGFWDWTLSSGSIYISERFQELIGGGDRGSDVSFTTWMTHVHDEDRPRVEDAVRAGAVGGATRIEVEYRAIRSDGSTRWMCLRGRAQRSSHGRLERVAGSLTDITDQKAREEATRRRADHDPLTALANRSKLSARIDESLRRMRLEGGGFALVYIDLDRFKPINDRFGHQAGDEVLRVVGQRLRGAVSRGDCVARMGGDEFVVMLEGCTNDDDAEAAAERIEAAVTDPIELEHCVVSVGASWGVRTVDGWGPSERFLDDADRAMYAAKVGKRGGAR